MLHKTTLATILSIFSALAPISCLALSEQIFTPISKVQVPFILSQSPPGTCIQGYVWREAFPDDRVCVTPEIRSQAAYDNSQAPSRIDPVNHTYGPNTCVQGYVWREANPSDLVCVTPETRSQTAYDNSQASSRVITDREIVPSLIRDREFIRRESDIRTAPHVLRETQIPRQPSSPEFLGVSSKNRQEALTLALGGASRYVGISPRNAERELLYKVIKEDSGMNGGKWINWIIIELIPNPNYHPQIDCPENASCDPVTTPCYMADPRRCGRR
jgi:hypothetical protein